MSRRETESLKEAKDKLTIIQMELLAFLVLIGEGECWKIIILDRKKPIICRKYNLMRMSNLSWLNLDWI